uniref:NAD(P)(+)--arginine ADP-ribosyltransferase n=1 Tax=Monopterus albus TaxID=43700 RepID=A0A3Q3IEC8_MONAL
CSWFRSVKVAVWFNIKLCGSRHGAKLLDMAPNAVDDMYTGCHKEAMKNFIHSGLLERELNNSKGFQKAWKANPKCSKPIPGGIKEHSAALLAYANADEEFTQTLNNAVETMGVNVSTYENHFHFKSLHFLLMDAFRLMKPKNCKTVYFVTEKEYKAEINSSVRFGRFSTGYFNDSSAKAMTDLDDLFVFNITSCFFVNLENTTCSMHKDMALLSPAEMFIVEKAHRVKVGDTDTEYNEIVLRHSGVNIETSVDNCASQPASGQDWDKSLHMAVTLSNKININTAH